MQNQMNINYFLKFSCILQAVHNSPKACPRLTSWESLGYRIRKWYNVLWPTRIHWQTPPIGSGVASPKFWEGQRFDLRDQQYLVWGTASRNTERQDLLEIRGEWSLWPCWLRLCPLHRCRSRQMFGGTKDFCPNFPKLGGKKPNKMTSKKTTAFHFMLGALYKSRHFKYHFCPDFP